MNVLSCADDEVTWVGILAVDESRGDTHSIISVVTPSNCTTCTGAVPFHTRSRVMLRCKLGTKPRAQTRQRCDMEITSLTR